MSSRAKLDMDGAVATITLSSEKSVISLTSELVASLNKALDRIEAADSVSCVVLVGSGSTFIVGADVKEMHAMSVEDSLIYNQGLIDLANRLESIAVPVIACLNGGTFGGGLEFALACSVRVAAEGATMGQPEVKLGIVPGAGGLVRLPRTVPPGAALDLMLSGRSIASQEALRIGLVDHVFPAEEALPRALELATEIASRAPLAVRLVKATVRETAHLPTGEAIDEVQRRLGELLRSADAREGVAAFIDKREPRFRSI